MLARLDAAFILLLSCFACPYLAYQRRVDEAVVRTKRRTANPLSDL